MIFDKADIKPDIPYNILHWIWAHNAMSVGI
ncbi:hypothetical protein MGA3_07090 [Bacillus methanolicus MGA3]|nr:hypothetical protein MGA3_07090 [Bacillus methanolicus MGA3]